MFVSFIPMSARVMMMNHRLMAPEIGKLERGKYTLHHYLSGHYLSFQKLTQDGRSMYDHSPAKFSVDRKRMEVW